MRTIIGESMREELYENNHRGANGGSCCMRTIIGEPMVGKN